MLCFSLAPAEAPDNVVNMLLQLCEAHASAATLASCARRLEFS
jgi:hypothetical protein